MSRRNGARIGLDFKAGRVRWVTATGPSYGRARVVIDGAGHTVDLYRPTSHWRVVLTFARLGPGEHHLIIRPLGRKDAASQSAAVAVDAIVVGRRK